MKALLEMNFSSSLCYHGYKHCIIRMQFSCELEVDVKNPFFKSGIVLFIYYLQKDNNSLIDVDVQFYIFFIFYQF